MPKFINIESSPLQLDFLQLTPDNATKITYLFSGQDFGVEASSRRIVVFIRGFRDAGGVVSSVTIGGVPATIHLNNSIANGSTATASAVVPAGVSGDITVNWSTLQAGCTIIAYSVIGGKNATPEFAIANLANSPSVSPAISGNTAVIAFAGARSSSNVWTWGGTLGVVEDSNQAGDSRSVSSASLVTNATGTITAATGAAGSNAMHVVGFR